MARGDAGYTLIALLAMIAVAGIVTATVAPTWAYLVKRDAEEELIYRGTCYAFAVERYYKDKGTLPLRLKELEEKSYIRKLYLDPVTKLDFEILVQGPGGPMSEYELSEPSRLAMRGKGTGLSNYGILGVVSTSSDMALRKYKDKEYHNEWMFVFEPKKQRQGRGAASAPPAGGAK